MNSRAYQILGSMSLDEKIGQLNLMSSYDFVSAKTVTGKNENEELISKGQLGAIYGLKDIDRMRAFQDMAMKGKNKIPFFFGMDVIHGLETTYPHPPCHVLLVESGSCARLCPSCRP